MPDTPWDERVAGVAGTGLTELGQFFEGFGGAAYRRMGLQLEALGQALSALATGEQSNFDPDDFQQDLANNILAGMATAALCSGLGIDLVGLTINAAMATPVGIGLFILGAGILWGIEELLANGLEATEDALMAKLMDLLRPIFADPIVLDLDGDGIELTPVSSSTTHYDIDNDGAAERTGWVSPHDGFLVHDTNGNGVADGIGELFGSANVDGYDELALLDSNHDGRVDVSDTAFADLMVWRDLNGDGVATSNEMLTLAQAGIAGFNLVFTQVDQETGENIVARTGTYIRTDGSTRDMASVQFAFEEDGTIPTIPQGTDIGDLLILPNLSGVAALPDLRTAMFLDATLKAMVEDLVLGEHDFETFVDFEQGGFLDVMYRWAGIDTSVTLAPGDVPYNFQLLAAFTGKPFDELNPHQIERVNAEIWPQFIQQMGIRFLFQAAWNPTLQPYTDLSHAIAALDPDSPTFAADVAAATAAAAAAVGAITPAYDYLKLFTGLTLNPVNGELYGDFDAFVANFIKDEPSFLTAFANAGGGGGHSGPVMRLEATAADPADTRHPWTAWYEDEGSLLFSIADAMGIAPDYVLNVTGWRWLAGEATDHHGTAGNDLIDETITYYARMMVTATGVTWVMVPTHDQRMFGYEGNDELRGNDGVDRLVGGTGDDLLKGGSDSDLYIYAAGDGLDRIIDDSGAADTIYFSSELNSVDLRVARLTGTNDLLLHFGDPAAGIILTNQWSSAGNAIEQFHFVAEDGLNAGDIASLYLATLATSGADTITGSWASERLIGLDGNDVLSGLDGDDILDGGAGADQLEGGNGNDSAAGGDGNDIIRTGDGNDRLIGGAGNDRLEGGGGEDTYVYNVGDGDDVIYDYWNWDDTVADTIVFGAGITASDLVLSRVTSDSLDIRISFVGHSGSVLIDNQNYNDTGIERVVFADGTIWNHAQLMARYVYDQQTSGNDTIWGSNLADVVEGGAGNDTIWMGDGNDTLIGGTGNDRLEGGNGADTYVYNLGDGDDIIYDYWGWDNSFDDVLIFGTGISAADVKFSRVASDWNDIRIGFTGYAGSIVLDNQHYNDVGIEKFVFADGTVWDQTMIHDRYLLDQQTSGNDTIWGTPTVDTVAAGAGDDIIDTGDGNDSLNGGTGNDTLRGGSGSDTYIYAYGDGNDAISDSGYDTWFNDTLAFGPGITLSDLVFTRVAADTSDLRISFRDHAGSIIIDNQFWSDAGIETIRFADNSTLSAASFEALAVTARESAGPIVGTAGNDILWTVDGNDDVNGLAGDDIIGGGDGNDILAGDTRAGLIAGGANLLVNGSFEQATTIVSSGGWGRSVSVMPGWTRTNSQNFEQVYSGYAGVSATDGSYWLDMDSGGGAGSNMVFNQVLTGLTNGGSYLLQYDHMSRTSAASSGFEIWWNGSLAATVTGESGTMTTSALTLIAQSGNNTLEFRGLGTQDNAGSALDNVRLQAMSPPAPSEYGNDILYGGAGDDQLFGMAGNDALYGGDDDDLIVGGAGVDILSGGSGEDIFSFDDGDTGLGANADTILDFVSGTDRIDVSGIDANSANAGDQAFMFVGTDAFSGAAGELRLSSAGSDTLLEMDLDGDMVADLAIVLAGSVTPVVADFVL